MIIIPKYGDNEVNTEKIVKAIFLLIEKLKEIESENIKESRLTDRDSHLKDNP